MPEVRFDQVSTLFEKKANGRVQKSPTANGGTQVSPASQFNKGEGSQTPPSLFAEFQGAAQQLAAIGSGATDRTAVDAIKMRGAYAGGLRDTRVGFVLTSDQWIQEGKALALHAGPASADWTLGLRAADEEIKAGHARYAQSRTSSFSGAKGADTFFDFPKVGFQFQAGNILPIKAFGNEVILPYGLEDFYLFFELLNQPPILANGKKEGSHNYVWIFYTSLQIPQVTLKGYFDPEGISWEDSAEEATVRWTASFMVHEMSPALWERSQMHRAYADFMATNGTFR